MASPAVAPVAVPAPDLGIPPSTNTVSVSIINTTAAMRGVPVPAVMIQPPIPGHDFLAVPVFSFYIHHPVLKRSVLYALGMRKDWENLSPTQAGPLGQVKTTVEHDVPELLEAQGIALDSIEAIIWSHWHNDHCGDPSRFGPETALVVGPGVRANLLPGYPADPNGLLLESDVSGRELRELTFEDEANDRAPNLRIGRFRAIDYFGDGSFYVLDAPGHTFGHLCALARVASGKPDSFVFMGGGAAHHGGEVRPNIYRPLPLPEELQGVGERGDISNPFTDKPCSGGDTEAGEKEKKALSDIFGLGGALQNLLPGQDRTRPFYTIASSPEALAPGVDVDEAQRTLGKLQEVDAADNMLVVLGNDEWMLGVVDFFPKTVNKFAEKGWHHKTRWRFVKDFAGAVGWDGPVAEKRDWSGQSEI